MSRAWIALGSNLDAPLQQVKSGLLALAELEGCSLLRASSLYRTAPWGVTDQPDFVNAVACIETELEPHALLQALVGIEHAQGRRRDGPRWGPRTLDLDLLLYEQRILDTDDLVLPHPRMAERAFVLVPLAEISPELEIPGLGQVHELLQSLGAHECRVVD